MDNSILNKVRLSAYELQSIQQAFVDKFLPIDHLWIFGSRANLTKKGGDIDLYIETNINNFSDAMARQNELILEIWNKIGEQKIDIVINILSENKQLSIYKIARDTGIKLI